MNDLNTATGNLTKAQRDTLSNLDTRLHEIQAAMSALIRTCIEEDVQRLQGVELMEFMEGLRVLLEGVRRTASDSTATLNATFML